MDQSLFFLFNRDWTTPSLDLPMAALSSWAFWWPIAVVAAVLVAVFGGFHGRAALICAGISVGITDGIVVGTIKDLVARPRPAVVMEGVRLVDLEKATPRLLALAKPPKIEMSKPLIWPVEGNSFPSSHASNNFALAAVLALFYRYGWLYFLPAFLIAYSRLYIGAHYPSDVLVGMILGTGVACLVVASMEALWRRFGAKFLPRLYERHPCLTRK